MPFLINQRTSRTGTIGGMDRNITEKNYRKIRRENEEEQRRLKHESISANKEQVVDEESLAKVTTGKVI